MVCFCYKETDPNIGDGTRILSYATEKEMLLAFTAYVRDMSTDVLTGWNIFGFDLVHLCARSITDACTTPCSWVDSNANRVR